MRLLHCLNEWLFFFYRLTFCLSRVSIPLFDTDNVVSYG